MTVLKYFYNHICLVLTETVKSVFGHVAKISYFQKHSTDSDKFSRFYKFSHLIEVTQLWDISNFL